MNILQSAQSKWSQIGTASLSVGISLFLGFFVPVGVALYWITSNLMTIIQQYLLNLAINPKRYVDEEELENTRQELEELQKASSNKKRSKEEIKREKEDYERFFSIKNKHLVFYSEGSGFYKYFAGYINHILEHSNIPIHYITSDPNDQIFEIAKTEKRILPYYIDTTKLITLMMKLDCEVMVMTMPDLENFQIKRSYVKKDIEYINVFHSIGSLNLTYRKGALDHYDTIFTSIKSQYDEIVKEEEVYNLQRKKLLKVGYPLLDDMISEYDPNSKTTSEEKTILIAPSWQKDNIIDNCLEDLLDNIKGHGYKIIVRPHPQHVRLMPERMDSLKTKYEKDSDVEIQTDFSSNSTVFDADVLITDWSNICYEYAFTTLKPVIFINTPMKIMNPDYQELGIEPFNVAVRSKIGIQMEIDEVNLIVEKINELFKNYNNYSMQIKETLIEEVFNIGKSAEIGGDYIIDTVLNKTENVES